MFQRILFYGKVLLLNPQIFYKKAIGNILVKVTSVPKGTVSHKIGDFHLDVIPSRNDWWKSMYLGCLDEEISHNIKKYLSEGGVFIDVGSGVGYFSAIASEIVGHSGNVYSFEPMPQNINNIKKLINSNKNSNITLIGFACGDKDSTQYLYIARYDKSTPCTMLDDVLEKITEKISVRVTRLDTYLKQNNIDNISLIKIDVEGYEYNVLKGLSGFFEKAISKPPIICEIFAPAYEKTGITINELYDYMNDYGYQAYNIYNTRIKIDIRNMDFGNPWRHYQDVIFKPVR